MTETRKIDVGYLARVEGESRLLLEIEGDSVRVAELSIFEPPRFFEALLQGRSFSEAPDITARICGICPVAYQISAVQAMENAAEISLPQPIADLRRILYHGEWISSHALHIYMLHAPDFLGYDDVIQMAGDHKEVVERGLALKKAGNDVMRILGGREIHPINVKVGGFFRLPDKKELREIRKALEKARDLAVATVRWAAELDIPDASIDFCMLGLTDDQHYAPLIGRVKSTDGHEFPVDEFEENIEESQKERSTALYAQLKGARTYLLGALSRYNLNEAHLTPLTRELAREAGVGKACHNPFQSIVIRSLEVLHATDESISLIDGYIAPDAPFVDVQPRNAIGYSCTEAPRGLLYHRYTIGDDGTIVEAVIMPPTSQNQRAMEEDLERIVAARLDLDDDALQRVAEQAIRNHDPCISCATHFLRIDKVKR